MNIYHLVAVFIGLFGVVLGFQGYLYSAIAFDALSVVFGAVGFIKKPKLGGVNVKKYLGAIALVTLVLGSAIVLANMLYFLLPSTGIVNYSLTFNPTEIDWGNVTLNENVTRSVTITNNGGNITALNMTYNGTTNLLNYTLTWDVEGLNLPYDYYVTADFTLIIYEANITVTDQFNIDIWIGDQT